MTQTTTLEVHRTNIGKARTVCEPMTPIEEGQVRLSIDSFALTTNNITYAVFGDMLGYWEFFPTASAQWGRVPAMGWATIVESRVEGLTNGSRYYGWYPMASHVTFTPKVTSNGFRDDGLHRKKHAAVYCSYVLTKTDPMYPATAEGLDSEIGDAEDRHMLLRGLGLTGFLAEEFFADGGGSGAPYFGAASVIVLSASSKTALGFAERASRRSGVSVIGVTSKRNKEMVEATGIYDQVVCYGGNEAGDGITSVETAGGAVSIDMAGNPTALAGVHDHFADELEYSMLVGGSHHDAAPATQSGMAGPPPEWFFAPTEVSRRIKEWGREAYGERCAEAIASFVTKSHDWLTVEHRSGTDGAESAWTDVHQGSVAPNVGLIVNIP